MQKKLKRLFLSDLMLDATNTQRIAYVGIMTALLVVCNMFFEFKLADTQFSLTIFFSAMAGIIIGPIFGFVACFLGDLVGFLYNSGGFTYMPWIGLSMALVAFISAIVVNGFYFKFKGGVFVKLAIVSFLTFLLCTVAINTTCFWIVYNTKKVPFFAYLITRLFVQGQIWNSLFNYGLLFVLFPLVLRIRDLITKNRNHHE
ncbi:MAG: ECF transporter S component [Clostridia bacterium]|nr:ECF transporter S component [Clostridia bacterium]